MQRSITGFRQDEYRDWIAELSCFHAQHVRHRPPFTPRPWVETESGRSEHIGSILDCPLCDRAELPDGLALARTAGPFDDSTLPAALRRNHRVAESTWGLLRVRSGSVRFTMETVPTIAVDLHEGESQPIPPGVLHAVAFLSGTMEVDFLVPRTDARH